MHTKKQKKNSYRKKAPLSLTPKWNGIKRQTKTTSEKQNKENHDRYPRKNGMGMSNKCTGKKK